MNPQPENIRYKIYPSLLDAFQNYLDSEKNWEAFYGGRDVPKMSVEEYERTATQELIDHINRVPFESEAADKGTAFNEVVDSIIEKRESEKMDIITMQDKGIITATYKGNRYVFPLSLCNEFADYYEGALTQKFVQAVLPTSYGNVLLYGYIDELMPLSVHDIKTTKSYKAYKFRSHWQHYVYPYCLLCSGNDIHLFEYNVTDFKDTYTETYVFKEERDIPILRNHTERFIEFLEANKSLITDKKVFGGEKDG